MLKPKSGVLLVDLDGTLLKSNSFRLLVQSLVLRDLCSLRLGSLWSAVKMLVATVFRKLRLLDRLAYKELVGRRLGAVLAEPSGSRFLDRLTSRLSIHIDEEVASCIRLARSRNMATVLTTAAFADYATPVAEAEGLDIVVASVRGEPENWRDEKRARTLAVLANRGLSDQPRILLSDHEDDMALAGASEGTVWVRRPYRLGEVKGALASLLDDLLPAGESDAAETA